MKRFSQYLVLTAILGLGGGLVATSPAAYANPQQAALETAMVAPASPPEVIHVPKPSDLANVTADEIVPPMEISATEAREWVADAGYSSVSPLTLAMYDGAPVYRGTAKANGETYAVIVDSWGNIAGWH